MYHRPVFEALIAIALVVAVFVAAITPWQSLLVAGAVTTAIGLTFGVATGFWYHVALWRALIAVRPLPPRWWVRPVSVHDGLDAAGRRRVMPWFYAGAVGFVITVVGLVLLAAGVLGVWRSS